jgi:hypothetical protein
MKSIAEDSFDKRQKTFCIFYDLFDKFMDMCKTYLSNVIVLIETSEFYHLNSFLFTRRIE